MLTSTIGKPTCISLISMLKPGDIIEDSEGNIRIAVNACDKCTIAYDSDLLNISNIKVLSIGLNEYRKLKEGKDVNNMDSSLTSYSIFDYATCDKANVYGNILETTGEAEWTILSSWLAKRCMCGNCSYSIDVYTGDIDVLNRVPICPKCKSFMS